MSTRSSTPAAFSSKFDSVVTPVRRPPPSSLRLVGGPLPARSRPKHTLPSLPRPAFHPKVTPMPGPKPRRRVPSTEDIFLFIDGFNAPTRLHQLHAFSVHGGSGSESGEESGASSPVSETSEDSSMPPSPSGSDHREQQQQQPQPPQHHVKRSSLGYFPFEVSAALAVPQPAALNTGNMR